MKSPSRIVIPLSDWLREPHHVAEVLAFGLGLVSALQRRGQPGAGGLCIQGIGLADGPHWEVDLREPTAPHSGLEAPERTGTLAAPAGAAADLYEVGALLYQALSGHAPFSGDTAQVVLERQLTALPAPLSTELPRPFRALIFRLLEPDPRDRYQSYSGVRYDLLRLLEGVSDFCIGSGDLRWHLAWPDFSGPPGEVRRLFAGLEQGRSLNLVGPSGSGKSRLLDEIAGLAEARGWAVLFLRGEPLAGNLAQSLEPLLRLCENVPGCAGPARAVEEVLLLLARSTEAPGAEKLVTDSLLEARLESLFRSLPVGWHSTPLLVVDDAQWLPVPLLRGLSHAKVPPRSVKPADGPSQGLPRTLTVVTAGREVTGEACDLRLGALDDGAIGEILESMAGPLPAGVKDQLVSSSGGSPFLAVEGLRGWVEGGLLAASSQGWQEVGELGQASARAGALLAQRLDLLSSEQEHVLAAAAVLGRAIEPEAVSCVAGRPLDGVLEILGQAEDQRLLWRSAKRSLSFCHDRLREELEARLSPEQSRVLHLAAGHWCAGVAPQECYPQAYHFHQAGRHDLAREPALRAGRTARRAGDLGLAERCLRMALASGAQAAVDRELAEVLVGRGSNFEEARQLLGEALEGCRNPQDKALVEATMATLEYRCDRPDLALEHLRSGLRGLGQPWPREGEWGLRIGLNLLIYFWHLWFPGRLHRREIEDRQSFELVIALYKRAAETGFELSNAQLAVWAHLHLLNSTELYKPTPQLGNLYVYHLAAMAGELRASKLPSAHWKKGLRSLAKAGTPHQRGKAGVWMAMRHYLLGRFDRAERIARRTLVELSEAGDHWEAQMVVGHLSNIRYAQGALDEALELAREAYYGAVRWNNSLAAARALLAWGQASNGALPEVLLAEQLAKGETSKYRLFELHQARASYLAGQRRYGEAVEAQELALEEGQPPKGFRALALPWKATWLRCAHDLASGAQRVELLRLARRAASQALELSRGRPAGRAHALREAGLMAARRGNTAVARRHLDESVSLADKLGQQRERALSLQARGQLGEALGWSTARSDLRQAERWLQPEAAPDTPSLKARFATLLETARALLESPSHDQALTGAAEALRFMLRAEEAWVLVGPPEEGARALLGRAPFSVQHYARCLRRGRALRVAVPEEDAALSRYGVRSALYVPLGPETAIFLIHTRVRDLFGSEDLALCDFLARLTASALGSHKVLEQLRDSEVRFRTLFENAGVGLQVIGLDGQLLAGNRVLTEALGLGGEQGSLDPLAQLEASDRETERKLLKELLAGQTESYSVLLRHRRRSGASAWTQVTSTMVRTALGEPARVVRAVSDVSTWHLQRVIDFGEQQNQQLALDLHDVVAQRLVTAGHKTYLSEPERAMESVRKELATAVSEVRRLHRDLASPLSANRSYRKALEDLFINTSSDSGLELKWRLRRDPEAKWPRGLPGLFAYRIVQEALANVSRHAQASKVRVRIKVSSGQLRGEVRDDGVGLTPPSQERAHLGLAGIRLRCELLGGRCWIRKLPEGGTRLRFSLPTEATL